MTAPEFSRPIRLDMLGDGPREIAIEADPAERAALAARFDLLSLDSLQATATLARQGTTVDATGRLTAKAVQRCVATEDPVPTSIMTDFHLRFAPPEKAEAGVEVELSADDCDLVEYHGNAIDLGEAVAETLSLELDPFPRSPGAEAALRAAGVRIEGEPDTEASPFAGLKSLLGRQEPSA